MPSVLKYPVIRFLAVLVVLTGGHIHHGNAQSAADRAAVLEVNTEFYRAFRESDIAAMAKVWSDDLPRAVQQLLE